MNIRIVLFCSILMLIVSVGSGCIKVERYVQDNLFYSSISPKIKIKIDDSYEYLDANKETNMGDYREESDAGLGGPFVKTEKYKFRRVGNGIKSVVEIMIENYDSGTVSAFLPPYNAQDIPNLLDEGKLNKDSELYYFIFPIEINNEDTSECYLAKILGKNIGEMVRFQLTYIENITSDLKNQYSCNDWHNKALFNDEQNTYLEFFQKRSVTNTQIIEKW